MKHEQLAKDILSGVGGKQNINSVVHCATRLRFKLKNDNNAKTDELKNLPGVITVMQSGGQYQVVVGNEVSDVYKALLQVGNMNADEPVSSDESESSGKKRVSWVSLST